MPKNYRPMTNAVKEKDTFKLFNFRPVFFGATVLAFGILFGYLHIAKGVSAWWLLLLLPLALIFFFMRKAETALLPALLTTLILSVLFFVGFHATATQLRDFSSATPFAGEQIVQGRVEKIRPKGELTELILSHVSIGGKAQDGKVCAYVYSSECDALRRLDVILLRGEIQTQTEYFNGEFFRANDIEEKVQYFLISDNAVAITGRSGDLFSWINYQMESTLYAGMNKDAASVVMGILLGDVNGLDGGLLQNIRAGGIAHLFAVSGLHVGVLYGFFAWLFEKTACKKTPKWLRFVLTAALLVFYAGICGFTSSVVRATVICLCAYFGKLSEIKIDRLETVGISAILIMLFQPIALFTVGFQLSFLACLGIVLLSKPIGQVCDEFIKWIISLFSKQKDEETDAQEEDEKPASIGKEIYQNVLGLLSASLATQITTAPVLLSAFGFLSGWSLLLNFVFIPLVSAVFSLLLLFTLVATVLPLSAAATVLFAPNALWSAVLLLFEIVDFSAFVISGILPSGAGTICYYAGCTFLTDKWNLNKAWKTTFAILCGAATLIATLAVNL